MAKRILIAFLGIVVGIVSGPVWSGKVTVTEPSGKTWAEGAKHTIKWTGKHNGARGHYGEKKNQDHFVVQRQTLFDAYCVDPERWRLELEIDP